MSPLLTAPHHSSHSITTALDNGWVVHTRQAHLSDYAHVVGLHAMCSLASRARRYAAGKPTLSLTEWTDMVERPRALALLTVPDGDPTRVIAMTYLAEVTAEAGVADLGILIADQAPDSFQSLGLGTALADHAARLARESGFHTLSVNVADTNVRALAIVEHLGGPSLPQTPYLRSMALLGADPDALHAGGDVELRIAL
ncbi:GNAT family N-acetyltransferase [Streptomyces sp. NPDC057062]|uniref:GNAT family N-acetyltransferase n=1 Tax=Streptomyces sp. NPDC057062 TaxID=3346011 RepID=UPI00362D8156